MGGLKRDFTDEAKAELTSIIEKNNDKDHGRFLGEIIDFIADIVHYEDLDIDDYYDNIRVYHQKVIDKEDMSVKDLNTIFNKVNNVDREYAKSFTIILSQLKEYTKSLQGFGDIMAGSGVLALSTDKFKKKVDGLGDGVIAYYKSFMMSYKDGKLVYHWDYITKLMNKSPEEISDWEYLALMEMIDSMSYVDENGFIRLDQTALAVFIGHAYIYKECKSTSSAAVGTSFELIYQVSPVFIKFSQMYDLQTNYYLQLKGYAFYDLKSSRDDKTENFLQNEMFKATMFDQIAKWFGTVSFVSGIDNYAAMSYLPQKQVDISIDYKTPDNDIPYYHVDIKDGFIDGYEFDGVDIYEFSTNNQGILNKLEVGILDTMYRDKGEEMKSALSGELIGQIEDKVLEAFEMGPILGALYASDKFALETNLRNLEIDINNAKLDEIKKIVNLKDFLTTLQIGASISQFNGCMTVNHFYVNMPKLQISLSAYAYNTGISLDINTVVREAERFINTGKCSTELLNFIKWATANEQIVEYINNLDTYLRKIGSTRTISSFTLSEIKQVVKNAEKNNFGDD